MDPLNLFYCSVNGVLFDKGQTTLLQCPTSMTGSYTVPNTVAIIRDSAFFGCSGLISVTIPDSVTSIEDGGFISCAGLTNVIIGNGVTSIGTSAFLYCTSLLKVTIGNNVTNLATYAFDGCYSLQGVYFIGYAPRSFGSPVFELDNDATVYYLPGTAGWGATFGGLPTVLWLPQIQTADAGFGVQSNQFGFNIHWAGGRTLMVEASTNLINWQSVQTNAITSGSVYFSDPAWTNYPSRFYRIRSP